MPNDLDTLMAVVSEINAKSANDLTDRDITVIIAYHRHNRARRAAGYKTPKLEKPKVDVEALLGLPAPRKVIVGPVRRV